MADAWARDRAAGFYLAIPLVGVAAIAIGFSTTYFMPMWRRTLDVPPVVHLHGALNLSWVILVISQVLLVRERQTPLHRRIGLIGLPLAIAMLITGCVVALWSAKRDFPLRGPVAASSIIGVVTSLTIFAGLVALAIIWRRWPDWHKRLMLLATIVVLWPAWFRIRHLMPWVPRPDLWFAVFAADSLIMVAALRDLIKYGRVHPVWLYFGTAWFIENCFEIYAFDSPPWRAVGMWIYRTFA
jgi:uncharacterized membrane protein YozB (DUF420 family)